MSELCGEDMNDSVSRGHEFRYEVCFHADRCFSHSCVVIPSPSRTLTAVLPWARFLAGSPFTSFIHQSVFIHRREKQTDTKNETEPAAAEKHQIKVFIYYL